MRSLHPSFPLFSSALLASSLAVTGCGGETPARQDGATPPDAGQIGGVDAEVPRVDAGLAPDAGPASDAGRPPGDDGGAPGVDAGPEPCDTPGTIEDRPCGMCGTVSRFCTSARIWEYAECSGESGECVPGTARTGSCGMCGTAQERCTAACAWEATGTCTGEGTCAPGELVRSGEGCTAGERDFRCSDACVLEPVTECASDPCPTAGATESVACGMCGSRTRFCTSALQWEYGACEGEGTCAPGSSRMVACGNCGTVTERCGTECAWASLGACEGEGDCRPGSVSVTATGCPSGQQRPTTCSASCAYAPSGSCTMPSGDIGERCTPGSCMTGLVCHSATGVSVCRETCADDSECTSPTLCFTGDMVCSDDCTPFSDAGCPTDAKCDYNGSSGFGGGDYLVCSGIGTLPTGGTCTTNAQCQRAHTCILDSTDGTTGRCTRVCDATHACPSGGGTCNMDPFSGSNYGFCQ